MKAASNITKHGMTFDYATRVFLDPYRIEEEDSTDEYGEIRFKAIGIVENRLLVVMYTYRNDHVRIISARKAEGYERRKYHEV